MSTPEIYDLQTKVLTTDTTDNPNMRLQGMPPRYGLTTQRKIVSLAINELRDLIHSIRDSVFQNLDTLGRDVIGNFINEPDLIDKVGEIHEGGVILGLHRLYTMVVGDPKNPITPDDLGGSVNETILAMKTDIEKKGNWSKVEW